MNGSGRAKFREFETNGNLPALSLVRFMADHTGSYSQAIAGVNTPELQVADNDFAVGMLVEAVAHSVYAKDTLIFIVEDDAQDGPDHVDAHRSTAFVVGPYVKHGAIVSRRFTTINMLRTITDVLGIDHLSLFDATQSPMADVFDLEKPDWDYTAEVSGHLKSAGRHAAPSRAEPKSPERSDVRRTAPAYSGHANRPHGLCRRRSSRCGGL